MIKGVCEYKRVFLNQLYDDQYRVSPEMSLIITWTSAEVFYYFNILFGILTLTLT